MLEFALNVKGDHSGTAGALFLHHCVLGVRGQAYGETAQTVLTGCFSFFTASLLFKKAAAGQMPAQNDTNSTHKCKQ